MYKNEILHVGHFVVVWYFQLRFGYNISRIHKAVQTNYQEQKTTLNFNESLFLFVGCVLMSHRNGISVAHMRDGNKMSH